MNGQQTIFTLGTHHHRLDARGLTQEEYLGISRLLMQRLRKEMVSPGHKRLLGLLLGIAAGGLIGFILAYYRVSASLDIFAGRNGDYYQALTGWALLLVTLGIFGAGIALQLVATLRYQKKFYALAMKRSKTFALPQTITLAENGVEVTCAVGTSACAWPRTTHRLAYKDLQILIMDQAILIWLPQAAITGNPDIEKFLADKTAIPLS